MSTKTAKTVQPSKPSQSNKVDREARKKFFEDQRAKRCIEFAAAIAVLLDNGVFLPEALQTELRNFVRARASHGAWMNDDESVRLVLPVLLSRYDEWTQQRIKDEELDRRTREQMRRKPAAESKN